MNGKRILIAGGSGGIGAAIARACSREGAEVFVGYASGEDRARKVAEEIQGHALPLDVRSDASVAKALEKLEGRVDGVVFCSGIHHAGPLVSLSAEEASEQLDVNLGGAVRLARAALVPMIARRAGSVLFIGSVSAHRMVRGHAVYSATKAGLEGLAQALAAEVAKRGVRVNVLVPGPVLTPMLAKTIEDTGDDPAKRVPLGRLIRADEVAEAAAFLLSERASAITGAVLPVDGGYLL